MEPHSLRMATPRTLVFVWVALVVLALLSLAASRADVGPYGPSLALAFATAKAALVAYFFMGLRYEGAAFRWLFLLSLALVGLIMGLTFLDLEYR